VVSDSGPDHDKHFVATATPGGRASVLTMRANGAHTVLVSGGLSVFTSVIADRIGFHEHCANELLFGDDGRLSGLVAEPVLGKDAKLAVLLNCAKARPPPRRHSRLVMALNDLAMLEAAGLWHCLSRQTASRLAYARIDGI
jgi:phosphoserine phosphatase